VLLMSLTPSRRGVLQAALLAPVLTSAASACTTHRSRTEPVDPDVALRAAAVARERALLDLYTAAEGSSPALAALLTLVRAEHEQHLAALAAPSPAPSGSATQTTTRAGVAPSRAVLASAERAAAQAHAADALLASRPLAAVLASLAASEASHLVVLT
jgi:hypothetical protein